MGRALLADMFGGGSFGRGSLTGMRFSVWRQLLEEKGRVMRREDRVERVGRRARAEENMVKFRRLGSELEVEVKLEDLVYSFPRDCDVRVD